jgi:hypothetical protein
MSKNRTAPEENAEAFSYFEEGQFLSRRILNKSERTGLRNSGKSFGKRRNNVCIVVIVWQRITYCY